MIVDLKLNKASFVIEVASNDGYLLRNFVQAGVPCLGIEPTSSTAAAARKVGVDTQEVFLSESTSKEIVDKYGRADLLVANNVLAHVPDINDFVVGVRTLLEEDGLAVFEFPHVDNLVRKCQFDTVYHEHFSYLSLFVVKAIFEIHGLQVIDVEELKTHGGSLRVFIKHQSRGLASTSQTTAILEREISNGINRMVGYEGIAPHAVATKNRFLMHLIESSTNSRKVVGFGAAAKGTTLINYAGVKSDLLSFVVDSARDKQGLFLPGSHIPILSPNSLNAEVDEVLVFPWNIFDEIKQSTRRALGSSVSIRNVRDFFGQG